jgi:hypothetical protein
MQLVTKSFSIIGETIYSPPENAVTTTQALTEKASCQSGEQIKRCTSVSRWKTSSKYKGKASSDFVFTIKTGYVSK